MFRLGALRGALLRHPEVTDEAAAMEAQGLRALLVEGERRSFKVTTADDLAHGLKTPLAVLAVEADRTAASGHADVALSIQQQIDRMHRQVDYHLARARAMSGHASGARCVLRDVVAGLVRALLRLHASRDLVIDVQIAPDLQVRVLDADLEEMMGNLLDNACRVARARVVIAATATTGSVLITVDDDTRTERADAWTRPAARRAR